MDFGWFSSSLGLNRSFSRSSYRPSGIDGLDLLVELMEFHVRENMIPLSPGETELVKQGTNL